MPILQIEARLQSSHLRHQYGIFGSKSQTSISRNATRAGSEEGRLFSQAKETAVLPEEICRDLCLIWISRENRKYRIVLYHYSYSTVEYPYSGIHRGCCAMLQWYQKCEAIAISLRTRVDTPCNSDILW